MKPFLFALSLAGALGATLPVHAHINLISPPPLMDGHAYDDTALKVAPFGAPGVDLDAAKPFVAKAGSLLDIALDIYKVHPGEIVVSYTLDPEGEDVFPVYDIDSIKTPIPHVNVLLQTTAPCSATVGCTSGAPGPGLFKAQVRLPDIEGTIILVVRQVMRDKMEVAGDGTVDLSQVYYHQAAKLKLVR